MVSLNYDTRELICKIVYYGPGLCGKTTNLQIIHRRVAAKHKGEMLSLATKSDRTLFFDFLPLDLGSIKGFTTKFQLYTVPGQVFYNETRKMVLRGADGVVFVADSQKSKLKENLESLENLEFNLRDQGVDINSIPFILQFNKMDLKDVYSMKEMEAHLNKYQWQTFEAIAIQGKGVFETLKAIGKTVIDKYNEKYRKWGDSKYQKKKPSPQTMAQSQPPSVSPWSNQPASPRPTAETNHNEIDDNIQQYIAHKKKRKREKIASIPAKPLISRPQSPAPAKKPQAQQNEEPQLSDKDIFMTQGNSSSEAFPPLKPDANDSPSKNNGSPFMDIKPFSGLDDDKS